jgi:hypothetical protein
MEYLHFLPVQSDVGFVVVVRIRFPSDNDDSSDVVTMMIVVVVMMMVVT